MKRLAVFRVRLAMWVWLLVLVVLSGQAAQAQQLRSEIDTTMACGLRFSGQIRAGDADLFAAAVASFKPDHDRFMAPIGAARTRICLDSPGGNLNEAVRIARIIHGVFGTAVPAGARCESSCAVIFMAGSRAPEADPRGIVTDRVLHPSGQLGFHRLRLDVPRGTYTEATVLSAFEVALDGLAGLVALAGEIDFPETLLARMLATPSSGMMHVETVGDAARWRIAVAPTPDIRPLPPLAVVNACNNHYNYLTDFSGSPLYAPRMAWSVSRFFAPNIRTQPTLSATLDGFGQEAASTCRLTEDRASGQTSPWGWVAIGETSNASTSAHELYPFQFYSRDTPLRALALTGAAATEPLAQRNAGWRVGHAGRCMVYSAGRKLDDDPCTVTSTASLRDDLTGAQEVHRFQWPSGAVTVLEAADADRWRINGTATQARQIYDLPPAMQADMRRQTERPDSDTGLASCFLNSATRNDFCFVRPAVPGETVALRPSFNLRILY